MELKDLKPGDYLVFDNNSHNNDEVPELIGRIVRYESYNVFNHQGIDCIYVRFVDNKCIPKKFNRNGLYSYMISRFAPISNPPSELEKEVYGIK